MKILSRFLVALCLTVIACGFFSPRTVQAQAEVPRLEKTSCMFPLPEGVTEGVDVDCAYLIVPQRYEDPQGETLRLAVAVIRSTSPNPRRDALVFNQGGPGGSTIDYFSQVLFDSPLRAERDLVLFDQRGTLYSEPALMCPEFLDETLKVLDKDLSDEEENRLFRQAADACRDRLLREGVDLSAFNSLENAHDIESLRVALGLEKINLYGVSYGTLLALHALREHPEGLRSLILDAVVPPQIDFNPESARTMDRAFTELFNACAADAECNRDFPNLEKVFFEEVDRLDAHPVMIQLMDPETGERHRALLNGDGLIQTLFQTLYSSELIPLLPKMIYDVRANRFTLIERVQSLITFDRTMAEGMYYAVVCAEDGDFDPRSVKYDGIRPRLVKGEQEGNETFVQVCRDWNVRQLGKQADEPVFSDLPVLILNGRFDPITPETYGEMVAQTLPNSYLFTFPNTGHGAIGDACADQIMVEFLDDPSHRPEAACLKEAKVDFVTTQDVVDFPVLMRALNLDPWALVLLGGLILGVTGLLSAWVVFPLAWLARLVSGRAGAPAPWLLRLAPWVAGFLALFGVFFLGGLAVAGFRMVTENDIRIFFGIPARWRWIFTFPVLSVPLTLVMVVQAVAGLRRGYWRLWRKVYFLLLTLVALSCIGLYLAVGALRFW
ncbi:MAG TPA: transporter [Anaerolinea thermolimosa]|uniref:Transporter n=1 Tax=Anaerolinea thermolimosa TaxID=229919 RepID=A0A3D1JE32_9CHLR|nr:alpha/beta fold hydrolase [Anaerolinea thermolimosa]GAP07587.1 predicted hydrolase [Anaerolinea thermolimosa]HCE16684.1 transporter [Anaerolinea thermolimosa]